MLMRRISQVRCIAVLLLLTAVAWGEPVSQLHATNYVNDFAHVLSAQTADELNSICEQLYHNAKAQVAVVAINTLDGKDVFDYAVELYQAWGIGSKSTNRGVLILYSVSDHKYWTTVGYGLEPILPDGKVGGFGREAVPLLRQQNYSGAVSLVTHRVADVIAQDAGIQLTGVKPSPPRRDVTAPAISLGGVVAIIILAIIVLASPLRKVLFWWLLFN